MQPSGWWYQSQKRVAISTALVLLGLWALASFLLAFLVKMAGGDQ
jgi:hypothetical protein